ncbi:MAG: gliding motility-associated C-terminal domain-containing protein [Bacteroidales bacterium]|nr:gliding motility-associated C-terminal domain-containing protein [Bacteroidales bacterium]
MLRLTSTACPEPARVNIDALSVDPVTNYVLISWTPLLHNVHGYIIFRGDGAGFTDTIWSMSQDTFMSQRPASIDTIFRIAAFNLCAGGIVNAFPSDTAIASRVFYCRIEQLYCERKIEVVWSNPMQSVRDIARFEIWASRNDGGFVLSKTINDTLQRSAVIDVSGHLTRYKIFVRAVSSDPAIYANSIADTLTLIAAPEPEYAYTKTVTVINNETVEIRCSVDVSVVWDSLFFFADNSLVRAVSRSDFLQNNRFLLPRIPHAFYHFKVSDTCGIIVIHSDSARPILLVGSLDRTTVDLEFSEYYGWSGSIIRYDLFEIRDSDTTLRESGLSPNQLYSIAFSDLDFAQIMNLSYFVVAYRISPTYEVMDSTRSNVVAVISRTEIPVYFPTGFFPNSYIEENRTFRPFFVSLPNDRMQFKIFNTFGQVVFSTTDPHNGWDGTFNNTPVQPGAYVYQFELIRNNITTRRQGVVTLIR